MKNWLHNQPVNQEEDAYGRPSSGRIKGATVFRSDDGGENWRQVSEQNNTWKDFQELMAGCLGKYALIR